MSGNYRNYTDKSMDRSRTHPLAGLSSGSSRHSGANASNGRQIARGDLSMDVIVRRRNLVRDSRAAGHISQPGSSSSRSVGLMSNGRSGLVSAAHSGSARYSGPSSAQPAAIMGHRDADGSFVPIAERDVEGNWNQIIPIGEHGFEGNLEDLGMFNPRRSEYGSSPSSMRSAHRRNAQLISSHSSGFSRDEFSSGRSTFASNMVGSRAQADPHGVLGVSHVASRDEIERAYRDKARTYHPDRVEPSRRLHAAQEMQEINFAHDVLVRNVEAGPPRTMSSPAGSRRRY